MYKVKVKITTPVEPNKSKYPPGHEKPIVRYLEWYLEADSPQDSRGKALGQSKKTFEKAYGLRGKKVPEGTIFEVESTEQTMKHKTKFKAPSLDALKHQEKRNPKPKKRK